MSEQQYRGGAKGYIHVDTGWDQITEVHSVTCPNCASKMAERDYCFKCRWTKTVPVVPLMMWQYKKSLGETHRKHGIFTQSL